MRDCFSQLAVASSPGQPVRADLPFGLVGSGEGVITDSFKRPPDGVIREAGDLGRALCLACPFRIVYDATWRRTPATSSRQRMCQGNLIKVRLGLR